MKTDIHLALKNCVHVIRGILYRLKNLIHQDDHFSFPHKHSSFPSFFPSISDSLIFIHIFALHPLLTRSAERSKIVSIGIIHHKCYTSALFQPYFC